MVPMIPQEVGIPNAPKVARTMRRATRTTFHETIVPAISMMNPHSHVKIWGGFRGATRFVGKDDGMTQKVEEYEDIPGTWVFDAQRARIGYRLNEFLYSLMKAENRKEFLADERTYTMKFGMTEEHRDAVLHRHWNKLLELGGVSYALAKLAFTDGKSYQFMASQMTGMAEKDYVAMMLAGGRSPDGWRSKSERKGKD